MSEDSQAGDITTVNTQLDLDQIKKRSVAGAIAFTTRTFLLQIIALVAVFLLTIFLTPEQYGIFFVVEATVSFLIYFSDVGLGAALIQKKQPLSRTDLTTTFTIQQTLASILVVLALIYSDRVAAFYHYGPEASLLFKALVFSFFLSSLKTIPSILLERDLEFNKLVIPQILENLVFYGTAVYFAWQGRGVTSYTYAVLARAAVGFIAIYLLKPWPPGISFDLTVAKRLTSFGAPFQLNSILSLIKDKLLVVFLGKVLTGTQVGYIGWAEKWSLTPIRFFADPVLKVTFPAYSRLQDNRPELKKAIEKSIFFVSFLTFPAVFGLIAIAPHLVSQIPRYSKWEPALIALTLYSFNTLFSSISITLTNTLNATGRVTTTLKLMVMWTILTWILTPILIKFMGVNGVALASALTASSSLVAFWIVRKIVDISLLRHIFPPLVNSVIMFSFVWLAAARFATSLGNTLGIAFLGLIVYLATSLLTGRPRLVQEFAIVKKYLKLS